MPNFWSVLGFALFVTFIVWFIAINIVKYMGDD